jgi:hypothetical protein
MSTPHVSGAAACCGRKIRSNRSWVKNLLLLGGDIRPTLIDRTLTGRRLNIANSFQSLAENDVAAPVRLLTSINSQNGEPLAAGGRLQATMVQLVKRRSIS